MATETKTVKPQEGYGTRFWNWLTETQVWTSVFRHERPNTDRNRVLVMLSNVFLHLHPVRIRKSGVKLRYTWCMGGLSFFLFLVLTFTGLLLMFYYRPTLEYAYSDIVGLREHVPLGIMREIHRWGAHAMVITVWLHMFRVFMTGSYKPPREFNWSIGVIMLVLTLLLSFTGYLLPWDQLAFWAVTVGTNIASSIPLIGPQVRELLIGGRAIDQPTLIRFYVMHVIVLPGVLGALFVYHMWRIRKDGGLARADRAGRLPAPEHGGPVPTKTYTLLGVARGTAPAITTTSIEAPETTVNAVPDLVRRAAIAILGTIAIVSIMSVFIGSPLEEPANALVTPNPAKAPWYFLWLQEIVTDTTIRIGSFTLNGAFVGGVILPGLLIGLMTIWPWLDRSPSRAAGAWLPRSRRAQNIVFLLIIAAVLALTFVGMVLRGPYWNIYWPWEAWPAIPGRI
jgi:quinol-cytochrome oxidoreductase complex cytochrome b subunit